MIVKETKRIMDDEVVCVPNLTLHQVPIWLGRKLGSAGYEHLGTACIRYETLTNIFESIRVTLYSLSLRGTCLPHISNLKRLFFVFLVVLQENYRF